MARLLSWGSPDRGLLHAGDSLAKNDCLHNCPGLTTRPRDAPMHFSPLSSRQLHQSYSCTKGHFHQHPSNQDNCVGDKGRVPASHQANGVVVGVKLATSGTRLKHCTNDREDESKRRKITRFRHSALETKAVKQSLHARPALAACPDEDGTRPRIGSGGNDPGSSTQLRKEGGKRTRHSDIQCVDQHVHELIWQWKNSNTLQEHYIDHVFLAEGCTHIIGIINNEVVLICDQQIKKLIRFVSFYHVKFGFCWAGFELDKIGAVDSSPLAIVAKSQWKSSISTPPCSTLWWDHAF